MKPNQNGSANGTGAALTQQATLLLPDVEATGRANVKATDGLNGNSSTTRGSQLHPESLVPRLGDYLMEMGVLQSDELFHALAVQKRRERQGRPILLGQLLLELGYVDRATLDHAVTMQVMELHEALTRQNQRLEEQVAERTEQLRKALEQAKQLQRHKDEFVNAISHELRTPLTFILGYLELFTMGELGAVSTAQEEALSNMRSASDRLHHLINNLLFFAAFTQQEFDIVNDSVSVLDLFHAAVKRHVEPGRKREVRLLVGAPAKDVLLCADGEKIIWVISELLENAIKFTNPGDQVSLIGRHKGRDQFEIVVKDNGPGIPPQRLDEVFVPFRQLDGSTTRKVGGIGLGLSLAQRIIQAHGSRIEIASQLGKGTQVSFSLPLYS